MGWLDVYYPYADACPLPGEDYITFTNRLSTALQLLYPDISLENVQSDVDNAWNSHLIHNATQLTVTMKRDINPNSIYNSSWADWDITEVHSATLPTITFSAVEKARAATGSSVKIAKSVEEKQIVFGWANVSKEANGAYPIDWDGDVTTPDQLENAAYNFVMKYRNMGEQHQEGSIEGTLIESVMFTKEKQAALGIPDGIVPEGWWVGFHIPDKEVFAKVKSGEYQMFSVEGDAYRSPTGQ